MFVSLCLLLSPVIEKCVMFSILCMYSFSSHLFNILLKTRSRSFCLCFFSPNHFMYSCYRWWHTKILHVHHISVSALTQSIETAKVKTPVTKFILPENLCKSQKLLDHQDYLHPSIFSHLSGLSGSSLSTAGQTSPSLLREQRGVSKPAERNNLSGMSGICPPI